jgi:hypothetical protein
MRGIYFLADFCSHQIWGLKKIAGKWVLETLVHTDHAIASFGQDKAGELYLADYNTGIVFQISAK